MRAILEDGHVQLGSINEASRVEDESSILLLSRSILLNKDTGYSSTVDVQIGK